jgi:hypothetical protein
LVGRLISQALAVLVVVEVGPGHPDDLEIVG